MIVKSALKLAMKYVNDDSKKHVLICPYCKKSVIHKAKSIDKNGLPSESFKLDIGTEYIKMKSGHETFFHIKCLQNELERLEGRFTE